LVVLTIDTNSNFGLTINQRGKNIINSANVPKNQRNAMPPLTPLSFASENTQTATENAISNATTSIKILFKNEKFKRCMITKKPRPLHSKSGLSSFKAKSV
jgi:hypothetical protein